MFQTVEELRNEVSDSVMLVHDYIKTTCETSEKGYVYESYSKIGESLGISNVQVHRAIKKLCNKLFIAVRPSKKSTDPNYIYYYGPFNEEEFDREINSLTVNLESSVNHLVEKLKVTKNENEHLKFELENSKRMNDILMALLLKRFTEEELACEIKKFPK